MAMSSNERPYAGAPFRKVHWAPRDIEVERRRNGEIILRSRVPMQAPAPHLPHWLSHWAAEHPERTRLAQRRGADRAWQRLSWATAKQQVDALTQALLNLRLGPGRVVAILSGNSLEHALLTLAAMQARLPVAPISPAYSLVSQDHVQLKHLFDLVDPALVMVQDGPTFQRALDALPMEGRTLVHVDRRPDRPARPRRRAQAGAAAAAWPIRTAPERPECHARLLPAARPHRSGL